MSVEAIAGNLGLGALLLDLRDNFGGYEILDHWTRGEFHHDLLLRVEPSGRLPGPVLVVATNCNGGDADGSLVRSVCAARARRAQ